MQNESSLTPEKAATTRIHHRHLLLLLSRKLTVVSFAVPRMVES